MSSCESHKCLVLTYNTNNYISSRFDYEDGTIAYQYIINVDASNDSDYRIQIHIENQRLPNTDFNSLQRFTVIKNNVVCREATFSTLTNVDGVHYTGTYLDCYNNAKLVIDGTTTRTLTFGYLI
jgi:hypothetical protein